MENTGFTLSLYKRAIMCILCVCFMWISNTAAATLEPTEVQLDKLTVQQVQQAAEAGDPDAQYALGYMYYYGKRVPQNTQEAMQWIKRASVQGQEQAVKAIALLGGNNSVPTAPVTTQQVPISTESNPVNLAANPAPVTQTHTKTNKVEPSVASVVTPSVTSTGKITSFNGMNSLVPQRQQLLEVPSTYHTVQLLGSYSEKEVLAYINANHLQGKVAYYRGDNKGKDWYVVLYGLYKTRSEAQLAVSSLPETLRKKNPWVKSIASVQANIKDKLS